MLVFKLYCLASLGLAAACGGASFEGGRFSKEGTTYHVGSLAPSWERLHANQGDLAFYRENHGTISVNATCKDYDDVPAEVLVNHLLFGTTHRRYVLEEEVTLDGRGARHAVVECELDGVPVRLEMYLLTRNGCVFDLDYVSGRNAPAQHEFAVFVRSFHIERAGRD